ncbi:hypothetical protein ACFYXM_26480 [Streptomyces sp. NPDC002476]|uniref:hypothetical protein n=1 Tax=Streptomyces sp. NPDC002476 TaxID=3364648 RepID=UPI0036A81ED3
MADERYEWLDEDAAEHLLRGEPVASLDGHRATEAQELAAALEAVARTARPAAGELPGEAAALAAFRAAAHSAPSVPTNAGDLATSAETPGRAEVTGHVEEVGEPVTAGVLDPVRIRPVTGTPVTGTPATGTAASAAPSAGGSPAAGRGRARTRSPRRNGPVRFGLVASFAGCALGGVAMAASAGMLPGPFGEHTPGPATSVTADASPDGVGSQDVTGTHPPADPPASPDASPSAPRTGSSTPGDRDTDRSGEDTDPGSGDGRTAGRGPDGSPRGKASGKPGNRTSGHWYAEAKRACRDYRNGDLDDDRRRALEAMAKGARNLERFCDRILAKGGKGQNGQNGQGDQDGQGGPGDGDRTAEDGDDDGHGRGQGVANEQGAGNGRNQALPAARFTTAPKRPSVPPSPRRSAPPYASPSASSYAAPSLSPSTIPFAIPPSAYRAADGPAAGSFGREPCARGCGSAAHHQV